jgi:Lysozyme like domain/D-alanyl-D-alanine carboxypeptidase
VSDVLTPRQIAEYAYDAGFRGQSLTTAVAVALAESGGRPGSHNTTPPDDSYGLWQVNMYGSLGPDRRRDYHLKSDSRLFDPAVNARAAFSISSHGTSFQPWSTYIYGQYRDHLGAARKAAQAVSADGGHGSDPGKSPTGKGKPTAPGKDHGKDHKKSSGGAKGSTGRVVLDLAELARLGRLFEDSATRVEHTRLALRRLATDIEPARTRLTDPALATLITNVLTAIDAPTQLPQVASRLQRQGTYAEKVRRLAEQADGGDGKWTSADGMKFVQTLGPTVDPYERAVLEAFMGGAIVPGGHLAGKIAPKGGGPAPKNGGTTAPPKGGGTTAPPKGGGKGKLPDPGVEGLKNGRVPPTKLSPVGQGEKLTKAAATEFRQMDAAANAAGIDLRVNSGYRTYAEQASLYDAYLHGNGNLAAAPGTSTHGLGLSADIDVRDPKTLNWLRHHAATYGFVNDVPSESWHWTYKPH